jgi:hypothetical protein
MAQEQRHIRRNKQQQAFNALVGRYIGNIIFYSMLNKGTIYIPISRLIDIVALDKR